MHKITQHLASALVICETNNSQLSWCELRVSPSAYYIFLEWIMEARRLSKCACFVCIFFLNARIVCDVDDHLWWFKVQQLYTSPRCQSWHHYCIYQNYKPFLSLNVAGTVSSLLCLNYLRTKFLSSSVRSVKIISSTVLDKYGWESLYRTRSTSWQRDPYDRPMKRVWQW